MCCAKAVNMWSSKLWVKLLSPCRTLGIDVDTYDSKRLKKAYFSWLKVHHPDKAASMDSDDEYFLRSYSKLLKDLPPEIDDTWKTIFEVEQAVIGIDKADNEEKLVDIRRKIHPFVDFPGLLDVSTLPTGYMRALKDCVKYVKGEIFKVGTTFCKNHHSPKKVILKAECNLCKEESGILTVCKKHSNVLRKRYVEECLLCQIEENYDYSDDLPDLDDVYMPSEGDLSASDHDGSEKLSDGSVLDELSMNTSVEDKSENYRCLSETESEAENKNAKLHMSVVHIDETPDLLTFCREKGTYTCKLCDVNIKIMPSKKYQHTSIHKDHFITKGSVKVLLCKQKCRNGSHYHCITCPKTIVRRIDAVKHINNCSTKQNRQKNVKRLAKSQNQNQKVLTGLYSKKKAKREKKNTTCPECKKELLACNLLQHIRTVHSKRPDVVTQLNYKDSVCVDPEKQIYLVQSDFPGANFPIHAQRKIKYSRLSEIDCEGKNCRHYNEISQLTYKPDHSCVHVQSIPFSSRQGEAVDLQDHPLLKNILKKNTIKEIKDRKRKTKSDHKNLVVVAEYPHDENRVHFSVVEDEKHTYSKLGRVRVTYEKPRNIWMCSCCSGRSCMHIYISKWAALVKFPDIFQNNVEKDVHCDQEETKGIEEDLIRKMIQYELSQKRIPDSLPSEVLSKSRANQFPSELHPTEENCHECDGELNEELVTSKAVVLTKNGPISDIKTFTRNCEKCHTVYKYQEYCDGIHNFNNKLILSLELCLHIRCMLMVHTAVSRVIQCIEHEFNIIVPYKDMVLDAYLHFEVLTDHQYQYYCHICGMYPTKLCGDGNKKTVFNFTAEELSPVPDSFDGKVNCEDYWKEVNLEILSRAFITGPSSFKVQPTLHNWAGWIGKKVRNDEHVLNTEYMKKKPESGQSKTSDEISDEYLQDLLYTKSEEVVKKLCKELNLSTDGNKTDLILRLRRISRVPDLYKKIFTKIKGHCGGWIALVCEHGCTYAVKFVIRAESVRDYADLLLSFKHFPNIMCSDLAPRLARHMNLRSPEFLPFHPNEGSFVEPTTENIKAIKRGELSISLPWLVEPKFPHDINGHPISGCNEHYSCLDKFHESNWKSDEHKCRRISCVKELGQSFNTQAAEQLNADMGKNNYFLNMMSPTTQIFVFKLLIELRNVQKNKQILYNMKKHFPSEDIHHDHFGRLVSGEPVTMYDFDSSDTDLASEIEDLVNVEMSHSNSPCSNKEDSEGHFSGDPGSDFDDKLGRCDGDKENFGDTAEKDVHKDFGKMFETDTSEKLRENDMCFEDLGTKNNMENVHVENEKARADPDKNGRSGKSQNVNSAPTKKSSSKGNYKPEKTSPSTTQFKSKSKNDESTDGTKQKVSKEYQHQKFLSNLPWHRYKKQVLPNLPNIPEIVRERISNFCSIVGGSEVLQFHSYVVKRASLCTLKSNEWLDDQVVNAFVNLLVHEYNLVNEARKVLHLDSFLMTSLLAGRSYTSLKKTWFSEYSKVLLPVHTGNHWCLLLIDIEEKNISYIDPLLPGIKSPQGYECIKKIKSFSINRLQVKPLDISFKEFAFNPVFHNIQEDGASCGVWILMFTEQILNGTITPKQMHVPYFRWYVAYKLYTMGKRKSEQERSICDVQCKIKDCKLENVTWLQCDAVMCARWVHTFCVDLTEKYNGPYVCPMCNTNN